MSLPSSFPIATLPSVPNALDYFPHPPANPRRVPSPLTRLIYARVLDDFFAFREERGVTALTRAIASRSTPLSKLGLPRDGQPAP